MQINKTTLRGLFQSFRTIFMEAYQAAQDNISTSIAMRTSSTAAEEVYHWLGALPGMKKLIDEIRIENVKAHNYTIPNDEWEDTIAIRRADVERDREGIYTPLMRTMGDVARQHDAEQLAMLLVAGFTETCYTGKAFFATNHEPIPGGTKFGNKGTKKLSQANFRLARENLRTRKNAAGRIMGLGRDMVLLVSPKNESLGLEILEAERTANGQTNVDRGTARLVVWPELSGAGTGEEWFLFDAGHPMQPLILQVEKEVELISLDDPESDHVFKKHEFLYQAYKRTGYGYGLPELIWGSDGSTAA